MEVAKLAWLANDYFGFWSKSSLDIVFVLLILAAFYLEFFYHDDIFMSTIWIK
jgi:hypothetical protein